MAVCNKLLNDGLTQRIIVVQSTLSNSNLLGKSKKIRVMGSSSHRQLDAINEIREMVLGMNATFTSGATKGWTLCLHWAEKRVMLHETIRNDYF